MFKARFIALNVTQAASQLKRSSHCLVVPPAEDAAIVFGGELQPRVPVDNALHNVALPSGNYELKDVLTATSAPPPRVGSALVFAKEALWVWGGRGGVSMECLPEKGDVWRFKSGEWTRIECDGEPPQDRSYHVMVTYNEDLFVHAGCPAAGRLSDLYRLSLASPKPVWTKLADAPGPGRGGTVLGVIPGLSSFVRWGGFAGYELGGPLDIYHVPTNTWYSVDVAGEQPAKRSVHALVGLRGAPRSDGIVALMLFGEGEASDLGHAGAGKFHDDAWALVKAPSTELTEGWSWEKLTIPEGTSKPQARGWFAADAWADGKVVFQGGLNTDNERLSDAWILEVEKK